MNVFLKVAKYLVLALFVLSFVETKASNDGSAGAGVPLASLPTLPPFINEKPADGDNGDEEDDGNEDRDTDDDDANPRTSIPSAFYLSLDGHTLYANPDGTHDMMTLWVCDMQGNVVEEVLFEMNGTRQSHTLSPSLAGEYEVYLNVGDSYYMGSVWI